MSAQAQSTFMNSEEIRFRSSLVEAIRQKFPKIRMKVGSSSLSVNGLEYEQGQVEIYVESPETLCLFVTVPNDLDLARDLARTDDSEEVETVSDVAIERELRNLAEEVARGLIRGLDYTLNHTEVEKDATTVLVTVDGDLPSIDQFKTLLSRLK